MNNLDKIKNAQSKKERQQKAAEVIWVVIGLVLFGIGVICSVLNIIINNIGTDTTNMYRSPLYFLVEGQEAFVKWWNSWVFFKIESFNSLGVVLVLVSAVYLLIVFGITASKADMLEKKTKAKKLRERNAQRFLEDQKAAEEARLAQAPIEAEAN